MKDMEHFTKLIQKTTQQLLVEWSSVGYPSLTDGIAPDADIKTWRDAVLTTVSNFDNTVRAKLEGIAERVNNLSDRAGQEAINSLRDNISNTEKLDAQPDHYNRALWLHLNDLQRFVEAEDARFAIEYRMSPRLYSGYEGPENNSPKFTPDQIEAFKHRVSETLGINGDLLVEHFVRSDFSDDDAVTLHHLTVAYNTDQSSYEHIVGNHLQTSYYTPAAKIHLTYEPKTGFIEVYSEHISTARRDLAKVFSSTLLQHEIEGQPVPLRVFELDSLTTPRDFPVAGEPVTGVKLHLLKFRQDRFRTDEKGNRRPVDNSLAIQVDRHESRSIFDVAREEFNLLDFSGLLIKQVKLSIQLAKQPGQRSRSIPVTITHPNHCSNNGLTEADRQLRDKLLVNWGLVVQF